MSSVKGIIQGIYFMDLAIVFTINGRWFIKRINKYFPEFYLENKRLLMLATVGLTLPLALRGLFNILVYVDIKY